MLNRLPIVTMKVGVSVDDIGDTRKVAATSSTNPRARSWIDLPLDQECLLQVELKRRTLDKVQVSGAGFNLI